jgi:hypothetical protein
MSTATSIRVDLNLDEDRALALAQLCKRICWADMLSMSVDQEECYVMRDAILGLQKALALADFAPR